MKDVLGKASILAIGTELTTGQVTNRNSSWIAEKLLRFGISPHHHEIVADDRARIRSCLESCAKQSQFIFTTGGLGPTSDDFTREVIAEWLGKPLIYHEEIWQQIVDRLTFFGVPIAESNRQQCYFPEGSEILINREGTAAGFSAALPNSQQRVWIFPGPPHEVKTVWHSGVEPMLQKLIPETSPLQLFTWQCMGRSEAEFGEITEKALTGSGLQIGYRAHVPFIEIKVWSPESEVQKNQKWFAALEKELEPWIITRQGEDLATRFFSSLGSKLEKIGKQSQILVVDTATGGHLAARLGRAFSTPPGKLLSKFFSLTTDWNFQTPDQVPPTLDTVMQRVKNQLSQAAPDTITFALSGFTPNGEGVIGLRVGDKQMQDSFQLRYRRIELLDRMQTAGLEIALKKWSEWLDS